MQVLITNLWRKYGPFPLNHADKMGGRNWAISRPLARSYLWACLMSRLRVANSLALIVTRDVYQPENRDWDLHIQTRALPITLNVHGTSASSAAIHNTHPGPPSPLCISKALSTAGKGMDGQGCSFPPHDGVCSFTTHRLHQLQQVQKVEGPKHSCNIMDNVYYTLCSIY